MLRPVSCSQVSEDAVDFVKSLGIVFQSSGFHETPWVVGGSFLETVRRFMESQLIIVVAVT